MGTDGVPEEIVEAVVAGETIGAAQLTVEQQTIDQAFIEQKQPTASFPEEESVPKILLIDEMADWNDLTYKRLIEIAASKGVQVDLFDGHHFIIDDSYDGIIIFGGGGGNRKKEYIYGGPWKDQLRDLSGFEDGGGRFIFFTLPRMAIINDALRWWFGVTVKSEYLTSPGKDIISVPGGVLSKMWSGLEIGSRSAYDEVSLQTYFETSGFPSTSMSNQEGEQRKTSIYGGWGSGKHMFVSSFVTGDGDIRYRNSGNFLQDGNIRGWDNQEAAEILIDWLVGNQ